MNNFTRIIYGVFAVFFSLSFNNVKAQCGLVSSNGYNVSISVNPISIIKPATCPWGYNYNVNFLYNVSFNGNNIPANLYTLQGNILCDGQANFFSLPVNGGTGTKSTVSNPWKGSTDCGTATTSSLKCNITQVSIQGPGIPFQTINCVASILPIDLVSFNGRIVNNSSVYLNWVTASETNNKTFTVERSTDAVNWQAIKTLNGAVNSSTAKEYAYTDAGLLNGMYYYRLKQTDISGAGTYSNIMGAKITNGGSKDMGVFYNSNQLQFTGLGNSAEWEIIVLNSTASVVLSNSSINATTVQLPGIASGIYFVKLRNKLDNREKTLKFFKS